MSTTVKPDPMSDMVSSSMGTGMAMFASGVVAAGTMLYMANRPTPFVADQDLIDQSRPGVETNDKVSNYCTSGKPIQFLLSDMRTFYEVFQRGARVSKNGRCLGYRDGNHYRWLNYSEVIDRAECIGSALISRGVPSGQQTFIGIYSRNTPEYVIVDLACSTYSMVLVPLYDTLGPDACTHIINDAKIKVAFCDNSDHIERLLSHISQTPKLKTIVAVESFADNLRERADGLGISLLAYADLVTFGFTNRLKPRPPNKKDLATVCYTSGTTGAPKGVMISHENIICVMAAIALHLQIFDIGPSDIYISYLPLAHIYEKVNQAFIYSRGCQVGFFRGDLKLLMEDMALLQPTILSTVPRLLNRMYDKVMATAHAHVVTGMIFDFALSQKLVEVEKGIARRDSLWDRLVFHKVQNNLGGRIRIVISGSAPLSEKVLKFIRAVLGVIVIEGYGQTEGTAVLTCQIPGDTSTGNVGPPIASNSMKLVDVPEMQYYADQGVGEICVRGKNVFLGYLNMPEKTNEVLDKNGWLHTGDIGKWNSNGSMKIIDRKKDIFKLAQTKCTPLEILTSMIYKQGEYISPEKIENAYRTCSPIDQILIHGNSLKASLIALVVLEPEAVQLFLEEKFPDQEYHLLEMKEICANKRIKAAILEALIAHGNDAGLMSFEQVRDIHLLAEPFSIENGMLTPTSKMKRQSIRQKYQDTYDALYVNLQ